VTKAELISTSEAEKEFMASSNNPEEGK